MFPLFGLGVFHSGRLQDYIRECVGHDTSLKRETVCLRSQTESPAVNTPRLGGGGILSLSLTRTSGASEDHESRQSLSLPRAQEPRPMV